MLANRLKSRYIILIRLWSTVDIARMKGLDVTLLPNFINNVIQGFAIGFIYGHTM